jgi:FkbM family methyltransferase
VELHDGVNNDDMATNGELRLLRILAPRCRIAFDVGARVGDWSALARGFNPGLEIHCFEPSRPSFERLAARALGPGVIFNNVGLSSRSGPAALQIFGAASGMNSLHRRDGLDDRGIAAQQACETVALCTLDEYCAERGIDAIDLLKVDVEGHEIEVLRGGSTLLAAGRVRFVQLEYGGCNIDARVLLKDLFELASSWPYDWYKVLPGGLQPVAGYSQRFENFQYSNWLLKLRSESVTG